jgi:hypothetical protein
VAPYETYVSVAFGAASRSLAARRVTGDERARKARFPLMADCRSEAEGACGRS